MSDLAIFFGLAVAVAVLASVLRAVIASRRVIAESRAAREQMAKLNEKTKQILDSASECTGQAGVMPPPDGTDQAPLGLGQSTNYRKMLPRPPQTTPKSSSRANAVLAFFGRFVRDLVLVLIGGGIALFAPELRAALGFP